jgi:hypothetical protein
MALLISRVHTPPQAIIAVVGHADHFFFILEPKDMEKKLDAVFQKYFGRLTPASPANIQRR